MENAGPIPGYPAAPSRGVMQNLSGTYLMDAGKDNQCVVIIQRLAHDQYSIHWHYTFHNRLWVNDYSEVRDVTGILGPIKQGLWVRQWPTTLCLPVGV